MLYTLGWGGVDSDLDSDGGGLDYNTGTYVFIKSFKLVSTVKNIFNLVFPTFRLVSM